MKEENVTERPAVSGRMMWGLVVLTLGVLWTLDNLGQIDASEILRWWPAVALAWGIMLLTGVSGRRRPGAGWVWTAIGAIAILRPLGIVAADVSLLWPVILIVIGVALMRRAWAAREEEGRVGGGPKLDASAFLAGAQRKIVTEAFSTVDINSVIAGTTLDLRSAKLVDGRGLVDVYAMWGGIVLIVPREWRVVCEVTPILGVFQDVTVVPDDPNAPTLVVRGSVVMGGIEVRNDERPVYESRARRRER